MVSDSKLPIIPQGLMVNKKLLILIVAGFVLFLLAFIVTLQLSAPKSERRQAIDDVVDNQSAMNMIYRLQHPRPLVSHDNRSLPASIEQSSTPKGMIQTPLAQLEHNAKISVYQHINHDVQAPALPPVHPETTAGIDIAMPSLTQNSYKLQNQQQEKHDFLAAATHSSDSALEHFQYNQRLCAIKAGGVIPATLQVDINSDLPGLITAKVRQPVFDSVSGRHVLIPQGSTLMGRYDSDIAYGQNRLLIAWQRLIFPNGDSLQLQGQPGVDRLGASGLKDKVNHHYARIFGSSLMYSVLSVAGHWRHGDNDSDNLGTALSDSSAEQMAQTSTALLTKNMNIQPTLIARVGMKFNVLLGEDLLFPSRYCG